MPLDLKSVVVGMVGDVSKEPPIPCRGYEISTPDCHEYDCSYKYAGDITCDQCVVSGGSYDPRTGKRYVQRKGVKRKGKK